MINVLELQKKCINEYGRMKTIKEIGEMFDIDYSVVSFLLKAADISIRKNVFKITPRKKLPLNKIKKLYLEEDYNIEDLEVEFNVSATTLRKRLKEMGVKLRGRKLLKFSKEEIKKLYLEDKMTSNEIGQKLGCSGQTIRNFMKKNNISIRDPHYKGKIYKKGGK